MPLVTAIVGLPGSGKSTLLRSDRFAGYEIHDDAGYAWWRVMPAVRLAIAEQRPVALAEIELCNASRRQWLVEEVRVPIEWIWFANDPDACRANIVRRASASLELELLALARLTAVYEPEGEVLPVVTAAELAHT